jgi:hypothetical protein
MYSAKIYYTKQHPTATETVDNILSWSDDGDGITITFGDPKNPKKIERHKGVMEDIHIFSVNPAFF